MDVLIVSGDRDVLQLVTDDVTVLMTRRGISEMTRFTPEAVREKYGLTPEQYPDFAAIRGDPSDNLPNIPGVGEKTATRWIAEFGSLDALVDRVDEVKGKAGDALREHLGNVLRNRQLTELAKDVPLEAGPRDLLPVPWDRDAIHQLFDTLQFRVLRERLVETLPNGIGAASAQDAGQAGQPQEGFEITVATPGPDELARLAGGARGRPPAVRAGHVRHLGPGHRHADRPGHRGAGRRVRVHRPRRSCPRPTSGAGRPGWPTRPCPRRCTTPRGRCTRWRRAAWSWPG